MIVNIHKSYLYTLFLCSSLLFTACGEDSSNAKDKEETPKEQTVKDLEPTVELSYNKVQKSDERMVLFAEAKDDGKITSYLWTDTNGTVLGRKALLTLLPPHKLGKHGFYISVLDDGNHSVSKFFVVTVENPTKTTSVVKDLEPTVELSYKKVQKSDEKMVLFAEAKDDGKITSYLWKDTNGTVLGRKALLTLLPPHKLGKHGFSISVSDDGNHTLTKSLVVQVNASKNNAPTINLQNKIIYDNEDLELYAEVKDDGTIVKYEWKNDENKTIGDSTILSISAPHKVGEHIYKLTVVDNKGLSTSKAVTIMVKDNKYRVEENNLPVFVSNKLSDSYVMKQMDDSSFNALAEEKKYLVADKLLSSMFFAYPYSELKRRVESGTFLSDINNQLLLSLNNMDEVEERIHDVNRYYQNEYSADVLILSRFFEMSKLDKHFYNHWVSYILTQTILFSPAVELDTVSNSDTYGIYNRLYQLQESEVGMRYATFLHMKSAENWRRFRSPEDNGREMLEIYALDADDTHVPIVAQALQNWHLSRDKETLVVGLNKNSEPLSLMDDMKFTSGIEFYASLANSKAFTKGIITRLVNFMFTTTKSSKKDKIIKNIIASHPETWSDVLKQILFSEEYLLQTTRAKSIEESTFSLMKKLSYNSYYYTFNRLKNDMSTMGQASMRYKLGKLTRVPMDDISFATYQKSLRDNIFRTWSRDTNLSWNPKNVDETHNSDYFMRTYKSHYRRGVSSKKFMSAEKYEVSDNVLETQVNYINYLFNSVLSRPAHQGEIEMFQSHLNGGTSPQWFSTYLNYVNVDSAYQQYIRYEGRYYMQYMVFEYILRLDELYFYKEIK